MTDQMNDFDRQLAGTVIQRSGPAEPVDDAAIFDTITAAQSKRPGLGPLYAAAKFFVVAGFLVLSGGFLVLGLLGSDEQQREPAATMESPSPAGIGALAFPTGTFVADESDLQLEFRPDGSCVRAGTPCTYGVTHGIFAEMTFDDPSGPQVPAAYTYRFDGDQLTFEPRSADLRPARRDIYANHVYRPVGETEPLESSMFGLPLGDYISTDGTRTIGLVSNGSQGGDLWGGRFVVGGELITFVQVTPQADGRDAWLPPATYRWNWDGSRLWFVPWGEDLAVGSYAAKRAVDYRPRQFQGPVYVVDTPDHDLGSARRLLLSDPRLEYFVTVVIAERDDGRYEVTATIDEEPLGEGVGDTPQAAVEAALQELGEPFASDLAAKVPG